MCMALHEGIDCEAWVHTASGKLFKAAEKILERKLRDNPYHPFQEVCINEQNNEDSINRVFVYSKRLLRFYVFVVLTLASLLFTVLWSSLGGDTEYLIFSIASVIVNGYLSLEYYGVHTIVLDPAMEQYSVYRGETLIVTRHCHDIYLRLINKRAGGSEKLQYYLILNGWGLLSTVELCRETDNKKKLRQLGRKLASNLCINYFDIHDTSKHHIVCHKPPVTGETELIRPEE